MYIADLASVGIARHFEQQCHSSIHIGRRNRPAGLFCVVLVTFGRGSLPVAWRFLPALRPSNNFADTKTPKTSALELRRRMCSCFSSLLLAFVSLVLFLCFRYSSRLQSSWQYFRSPSLSRNFKAFGLNHRRPLSLGGGSVVELTRYVWGWWRRRGVESWKLCYYGGFGYIISIFLGNLGAEVFS